MMGPSPLRFQLGVALLAVGGAVAVTEGQGRPDPRPLFNFQDPAIDESSGLVDLGSTVLTVNDSGDGPVVYVVDRRTGRTVGRTTYSDEVVDVEAMAPGRNGTVWVGDIGDNSGSRPFVTVYQLPRPQPGDRHVDATAYRLTFPGSPRDAEGLAVDPSTGRVYVTSKGLFGGTLYVAPASLSTERVNVLRPVTDVPAMITDAAFFPGGEFLALRSYGRLMVLSTDDWRIVDGMTLPDQPQGEGLAMTPWGDVVLVSTEGAHTPVLAVPLTRSILRRVFPVKPSKSTSTPSPSATPTGEPAPTHGDQTDASDEGPWAEVGALTAITLGLTLGARAWFRRRGR